MQTRPQRILIVDNTIYTIDTAESLDFPLSSLGYDIRCADGAQSVMEIVRQWRPHVLFLDIAMSGMGRF